jgi:hypothetical protein
MNIIKQRQRLNDKKRSDKEIKMTESKWQDQSEPQRNTKLCGSI